MMNDRFKFRVYDKDCEQILYPEGEEEAVEFDGNGGLVGIDKKGLWSGGLNCIPMQCIGIKDKNGQFIYEGDIVTYDARDLYPYTTVKTAKIEWRKYQWVMTYKDKSIVFAGTNEPAPQHTWLGFDDFINSRIEVIGNIYENADLIEGGENGNN